MRNRRRALRLAAPLPRRPGRPAAGVHWMRNRRRAPRLAAPLPRRPGRPAAGVHWMRNRRRALRLAAPLPRRPGRRAAGVHWMRNRRRAPRLAAPLPRRPVDRPLESTGCGTDGARHGLPRHFRAGPVHGPLEFTGCGTDGALARGRGYRWEALRRRNHFVDGRAIVPFRIESGGKWCASRRGGASPSRTGTDVSKMQESAGVSLAPAHAGGENAELVGDLSVSLSRLRGSIPGAIGGLSRGSRQQIQAAGTAQPPPAPLGARRADWRDSGGAVPGISVLHHAATQLQRRRAVSRPAR